MAKRVYYSFTILLPVPKTKEEEDTLIWFFSLSDEEKLAQLVLKYRGK